MFCRLASNFILTNIQNVEILKGNDQKMRPQLKKTPDWLVLLLNCWMVLFLLVCEEILVLVCFLLLPFSFFISNITVMCKNKITPSSEFEMTLKELESSHLIYRLVGTHDHAHIFCDFLMFGQTFLSLKLSYLVLFFHIKINMSRMFCECLQLKGQ